MCRCKGKKLFIYHTNKSTTSSYSSSFNDHESLGADHEYAPKAQIAALDVGSSSAMCFIEGGSID